MSELREDIATWQFVRQSLRVMVPLLLLLATVVWLFYRTSISVEQTVIRADQNSTIQLAGQIIAGESRMLHGDVRYLAELVSIWQSQDPGGVSALEENFLAFSRHRKVYDQIRFIDADGREQVRVNRNDGRVELVPPEGLQDKSGRYYVKQTLGMERGAVYRSPFDLNIEKGAIEQPIKPVIRLGTPVFDRNEEKRGFIMVNYLGNQLLNRLRQLPNQSHADIWLLNGDGYWLLGPRSELEWGFMLPAGDSYLFGNMFREAWASMQGGAANGQVVNDLGIFTYARIVPEIADETWFLVAHVPPETLTGNIAGRTRDFAWIFIALTLLIGSLSGMIAYKDIQRRKIVEQARESERRFRGLVDSAPDAIVIVDQDGNIELVNARVEKWFGYSRQELIGRPVECLIPDRYRQNHMAYRESYSADPLPRPMGAKLDLYGRRGDGSEFPVEVSLSSFVTERGLLVTSIIRDITDRKQAEEAERQARVRYYELVNNLPVGVYRNTPGPHGHFLEANPAMLHIFEADSIEQMLTTSVSSLYCSPDDRKAFNEKILRQGYVTSEELHLKTLKGREFYGAITSVVKKDATGTVFFDGIVEDISERKDNELRIRELNRSLRQRTAELQVTNRELEAFSYSVSHDLRAPLRAMDGFSRTLLDQYAGRLDERGLDRLHRIRAAAQRMATLIDDLLYLARVSRAEVRREQVDLSAMAQTVLGELRETEPERQVAVAVESGLRADADPRLVKILLDNLLGNAWKFTGLHPRPNIEFGNHQLDNEDVFFVRDNGAGFDMAYADKLFGAFQRLHDTGEFPGTGIGLATAQRVINKHGGRIWAESAVGEGAIFYFTL